MYTIEAQRNKYQVNSGQIKHTKSKTMEFERNFCNKLKQSAQLGLSVAQFAPHETKDNPHN